MYETAKEIKTVVGKHLEPFVEEMQRHAPVGKQREVEDYIRPVALPPHFLQEKNTHPIIKGVASKNTSRLLRGPRAGGLGGISLKKKSMDKRMTI